MRINYNLSAMLTNTQLLRNERNQQSASERLASGLRINHSKDDPAGMAISNKLDVQIEGVRQASRNSSDGISVLETADSALNEVTTIVQRMRELAVQAANDTNGIEDRQSIQAEIDSLTEEVDRVSRNTEFNKKILLDGSLERRSYTNNRKVTVTNVGDGVPTDKYGITITADARQAVFKGPTINTGVAGANGSRWAGIKDAFEVDDSNHVKGLKAEAAGSITINGYIIELEAGDTPDMIYQKLREGCEIVDVNCIPSVDFNSEGYAANPHSGASDFPDPTGKHQDTAGYAADSSGWNPNNPLVFVTKEYGSAEKLNISCGNALLAVGLGLAQRKPSEATYYVKDKGTDTRAAEIQCYKSTDMYLAEMKSPVVVLDRNNPEHKKYFENLQVSNMKSPALYGGKVIDLEATDPDRLNKKYEDYLMKFYDKEDYLPKKLEGKITIAINGTPITAAAEIKEGMTAKEVLEAIKAACDNEIDVFLTDDERSSDYSILDEEYNYSQALVFKDTKTGRRLDIDCNNSMLAQMLGLPVCEWSVSGKDCKAEFTDGDKTTTAVERIGFSDSATITTKGNYITVTDKNGFEIELEAEKYVCGTYYSEYSSIGRITKDGTMEDGDQAGVISSIPSSEGPWKEENFPWGTETEIIADVTGYGMMTVHVGANEDQIIDMDIPEVSAKTLGIDNINLLSGWTVDKALTRLDEALTKISKVRSKLGAYQNRLESAVASLNANDEDLTASVSRIRDVDMAQETTEYTQHSILVQAATSVLAQANDMPQQALQLIQ